MPNGKIDRKSLPAPDGHRNGLEQGYVAPRSPTEEVLAGIWADILKLGQVGIHDNFFDLGGHSLAATRLVSGIAREYKRDVPVTLVFQKPTIEEMAAVLSDNNAFDRHSVLVTFQNHGTKPPFFCVYGVRIWAHNPEDPSQPFYALAPHGQDGRRAPATVEAMAADYVREMKAVQAKGPYFLAGYSFGAIAAFEMARQLQGRGEEVALLLLIDPSPPPGIDNGTSHPGITRLRRRLRYHLHAMRALPFRQRFAKLQMLLRGKIEDIVKGLVCRIYLGIDRELPRFVRTHYFLYAARQASLKYTPQNFTGRIVLLAAEKSHYNTRSIWSQFASDGVEIHELPGNHLDIMEETHAKIWGQQLRECLRIAQTKTKRNIPVHSLSVKATSL
jgi:aspartate racemase